MMRRCVALAVAAAAFVARRPVPSAFSPRQQRASDFRARRRRAALVEPATGNKPSAATPTPWTTTLPAETTKPLSQTSHKKKEDASETKKLEADDGFGEPTRDFFGALHRGLTSELEADARRRERLAQGEEDTLIEKQRRRISSYLAAWMPPRKRLFVRRTTAIWACATKFLFKTVALRRTYPASGVADRSPEAIEARRRLAAELREALVKLGPTFIKLGQLLSTRVDVLPPEVISELVSLQNEVPGFPAERAQAIVEEELGGKPINSVFDTFSKQPLAAASLAQVHRARLKTGEEVVVKIQRDGLLDQFDVDCKNIRWVAALADRLDPQEEGVSSNWLGIAKTSESVLYREIDFTIEKRACDEFRANMAPLPYVKVPRTYDALSTSKVLVMEYVEGLKITDPRVRENATFLDPKLLAERLTTSYLEQLCRHGFFHCDPHPGNVAVDAGYPGGRIVYYDFGMMDRIEPRVKAAFVDLVYSMYKNDPLEAVNSLERMGVLRRGIDRFSIERIAREYVRTFATTVSSETQPWENQMTPEEQRAERRKRRAKLGTDLFATQAERPFVFPPKFTFVFRAVVTIDGIGKCLDPGYDLTKLASPFLRELADLRDGNVAKTAALEFLEKVGLRPRDVAALVTQPRKVAAVKAGLDRIQEGDLKLRVRTLEVERAVERVERRQDLIFATVLASVFSNFAANSLRDSLILGLSASSVALVAALKATQTLFLLRKLDRQRKRFEITGAGADDDDADDRLYEDDAGRNLLPASSASSSRSSS